MKIYAYNPGSASAKALAQSLGIKRIKHEGSRYIPRKGDTVINWGASDCPFKSVEHDNFTVLNSRDAVKKSANKLETFKALSAAGVSVPHWTEDPLAAVVWLNQGSDVVVRHKLTGHSGEGIEIIGAKAFADRGDGFKFPDAPLYTEYIKKKEEYRIHVFQGDAFFVQRKARKMDVPNEEVNWKVRNLAGGFIFAHQNVEIGDDARVQAINAVAALGLDFGAVDVVLGTDKCYYVLEVNTACGLEGTTLEKYTEKFKQFMKR